MANKDKNPLTVKNILLKFIKNNPGTAFVYLITVLLVPLQDVGLPHLYGRVINAIQNRAPLIAPFLQVLAVIAIIQIGIIVMEWNETYHSYPALQSQIRKDIIEHLFTVHETNYDDQHTASLIAKMVKLPTVLYNIVEQYKMVLIPQSLVSITIVLYFMVHDVTLGLVFLIVIILVLVSVNMSPRMCSEHSVRRENVMNAMHEEIDDILRNMMSVYNTDSLGHEDEILDAMHQTYRKESKDALQCIMMSKYLLTPVILALYGFFMWRCYHLVTKKKMSTGVFVSMFLIVMSLMGSLSRYMNQVKELVSRKGVLDASLTFVDAKIKDASKEDLPVNIRRDDPVPASPSIPKDMIVVVDRVTYMYKGSRTPVLHALNVSIPKGQKVLIKGRIGCGKSTLLRLLMKYKTPQMGEIYLNGYPYSQMSAKMVRSLIGYVPQVPVLFNRSIYDNITYGVENVTKTDVVKMLTNLGLSHIFDSFPDGIDANVGKNGNKLSGGQRQIVWILRVLLQNPMLILMDEPTASIDDKTKDMVRELLGRVMQGRTVIMVTHDDYLETFADRILELNDGELAKDSLIAVKHHSFY